MECKNCGSPIFEGDKFCSRCGMRIMEETRIETKAPAISDEAGDGALRQEKPEDDKAVLEPARQEREKEELVEPGEEKEGPAGAGKVEPEKSEKENEEPAEQEAANAVKSGMRMSAGEIPLSIPEESSSRSGRGFKGLFKDRNAALGAGRPGKWIPRAIMCIVGVVLVILIVNSAKLVNSYHRNFSTPEEYYRWVEQRAIHKNAKTLAEYYVNHFVEYLHRYDNHTSGEIRVELGDAGRDMMELAGLDPRFTEGAVTFESTSKDSVMQSILGLEIGGEKLFTMDTIMDLRDEAVYMGFPELTKTYLGVDTGERKFAEGFESVSGMEPEEYLESLELLEILYRECPDKKEVEALADRYLELLLNSIDDVRMRTGKTARAGSIAQTCTTLEICLDKNDIQNMLTEFLEELQEDSEIETLLFQIFELAEELELDTGDYRNADELYEAFQNNIDEILNELDYYVTYHDELDMTVYVDDKGQIIGRTMEFPNSWDEVSFSYLNPHRGNRFGYKGNIIVDDEEILITGSGRESGNKVSGNFTVKYDGNSIIDIDVKNFNLRSLRKGYVNGHFTVTMSSGIGRALDMRAVDSYLSNMELNIDISMNRSSEKLSMEFCEDRELWGVLTITAESGSGKKIAVPSTKSTIFVSDDRDFEDWWDTIEWDGILRKADKAGLPSNAIDAVEEFSELNADEVLNELSIWMWSLMYDLMDEYF